MLNIKKPFLIGLQVVSVFTLLCSPVFTYAEESSERLSERAEEADLYDRNRLQLDFNPYDYDSNDRRDSYRSQRQQNTNSNYNSNSGYNSNSYRNNNSPDLYRDNPNNENYYPPSNYPQQ